MSFRKIGALFVSIILLLFTTSVIAAMPPKPGASCTKVGVTQSYQGMKYTCIKNGKKLLWDKGLVEKKEIGRAHV